MRMVLKNISYMVAVAILFPERAVRRNAEKGRLMVVSRFRKRPLNASKRPLPLLKKNRATNRSCFIEFWAYSFAARTRRGPSSDLDENKVPLLRYEILCVLNLVYFSISSSIILKLLGLGWSSFGTRI